MTESGEARWVQAWRDAGPALDAQRRKELRELTDARALFLADALLSLPWPADVLERRRGTSGLLEQQDLFQRLRSR